MAVVILHETPALVAALRVRGTLALAQQRHLERSVGVNCRPLYSNSVPMLDEAEDSGRAATIIYNEMYGVNDRAQSPGLRTFSDTGRYDSIYSQRISP